MTHDIQLWPVSKFIPYARNPRRNDNVVDRMISSIKEFGFKIPILVRSDGTIVDGHLRLKAAEKLAIEELPVILCDEWTEAQVKAFRLLANRSVSWAEWDEELLRLEMEELKELDFDLTMTGFDEAELDKFLGAEIHGNKGLIDPDMIPEPLDAAISRTGDLWILGDHRLLCGDSALEADIDRLLGGEKIQLVSTDPPYNVRVEPRTNNAIAAGLLSDDGLMQQQEFDLALRGPFKNKPRKMRPRDRILVSDFKTDKEFSSMLRAWFSNLARVLEPGRNFYIWGGYANCRNYPPILDDLKLYFSQTIIWVKNRPVLVRKTFLNAHEICFYGWREGAAHYFQPEIRNAWDVWQIDKVPSQTAVHLTEKPVEITVRTLTYSSRTGENVLDIFGGSGSTMIGAEMTGRHAFLMEIDPQYCDIIIRRWQEFTGKTAVLDGTDRTFDEIRVEREMLNEKIT